jgi:hypothetical protein
MYVLFGWLRVSAVAWGGGGGQRGPRYRPNSQGLSSYRTVQKKHPASKENIQHIKPLNFFTSENPVPKNTAFIYCSLSRLIC